MTQEDTNANPNAGKGKAFFERASEIAETGNWDYAIEIYLEGISRDPFNVEQGHKPLREVAMNRKVQGGKAPGMMDKFKRRQGKDPSENLSNACYLLAKDPGNLSYMVNVLGAARDLGATDLIKWIAEILLESQKQAPRRDPGILMTLTLAFRDIHEYELAIIACEMLREKKPNDGNLHDLLSDLSAKYTIHKGKYGQEGDFTKGVKDLDKQNELIQKDMLTQGREYLEAQVAKARQEYIANPTVPGKVNALVDALLKTEEEAQETEAIEVLNKAHAATGAYQFKLRVGDIKIRQMTRRYRQLMKAGDKDAAKQQLKDQLLFELNEYAERAINYPTDLAIKFELGRRQLLARQYDEAISSFQQAQRDAKRHVMALSYLGQCFSAKGLYREATDTFTKVLESDMSEDRKKDIRYNLGDAYMKLGEFQQAREEFSAVAQMDYSYKDVSKRLEQVNSEIGE